ncbi:MAG: hypothetical protein H0W69_10745, partial [Gemmatimonadaceae bacterium]|nr:hypothetical protein [Gemmatimonadaceae bacterium]
MAVTASSASAQGISSQCPAGSTGFGGVPDQKRAAQDACQKSIDLFQYMAPQLGVLVAGGNATLGQGGTLGGLGKFSAGLRVNALQGSLPDVDLVVPGVNGAQASTYSTQDQILPLPTADLAIGLFKGLPMGVTNVGGVDLLVSAAYLPEYSGDFIDVKVPDGSLKLGYGARVGIVQQSFVIPGVSISYLRRSLPTVSIIGSTAASTGGARDTLRIDDLNVKTDAIRLVASKTFLVVGIAVGVGQDRYESVGTITAKVAPRAVTVPNGASAGPVVLSQKMTRTNIFTDVSLNLPLLKIIGEIGQ